MGGINNDNKSGFQIAIEIIAGLLTGPVACGSIEANQKSRLPETLRQTADPRESQKIADAFLRDRLSDPAAKKALLAERKKGNLISVACFAAIPGAADFTKRITQAFALQDAAKQKCGSKKHEDLDINEDNGVTTTIRERAEFSQAIIAGGTFLAGFVDEVCEPNAGCCMIVSLLPENVTCRAE
ncbi:MAG: hypothetical protein HQM16_17550 [Deltaproteobacteria bacterium]|nr:hypothetical protein [Deltaproteobacteria bacterium]